MLYLQLCRGSYTMAVFVLSSQKYLRQIQILGTSMQKILQNKDTQQITCKIDITKVPLFFQIFSSFIPKIEICFKFLLDKNTQKQPLWVQLCRCLYSMTLSCRSASQRSFILSKNYQAFLSFNSMMLHLTISNMPV